MQNVIGMKIIKYIFIVLLFIVLFAGIAMGAFIYKAKFGFNSYETTPHTLDAKYGDKSILLLSKTNGFRHGEAIDVSLPIFNDIAESNDWNLYATDDAGVFNADQLKLFDLVIFNNATGKVLNPDQRKLFRDYILNGGGFLGIHGAGDDSHQWGWYTDTLIGARFSHHPIKYHIQEGILNKEMHIDSSHSFNVELTPSFSIKDEWYVFYESPRRTGANILYTLDEADLDWNGALGPFYKEKDFGMGDDHPVVWYKNVGSGRSLYSAMGHDKQSWSSALHKKVIEEGMRWAGGFD